MNEFTIPEMKNLLFYYPQHFNRTAQITNPFFDKMLEVCHSHGITFDILEEPDPATPMPRNPHARKADAFFWTVTVIRKILGILLPRMSFFDREKYVARIINAVTFGRFRYRTYITISGSMYHLFANLNPRAAVFDMQHGILYKMHPTFFADRRLRPQFFRHNLHFLFWGKGYEDNFIRGDEEALAGRTHVVGYPVVVDGEHRHREGPVDNSAKRSVVVSLQFTNSLSAHGLEDMKNALARFLDKTSEMPVKVLLKHHPRYNNCISIDDLLQSYHNVELTDLPLCDLLDKTLLHITFNSTTAFEFAQFGIPTYFIPCDGIPATGSLFYKEYGYPLYASDSIADVFARLTSSDNYKTDSDIVYRWYLRFYSPFDETEFLKNIK